MVDLSLNTFVQLAILDFQLHAILLCNWDKGSLFEGPWCPPDINHMQYPGPGGSWADPRGGGGWLACVRLVCRTSCLYHGLFSLLEISTPMLRISSLILKNHLLYGDGETKEKQLPRSEGNSAFRSIQEQLSDSQSWCCRVKKLD